MKRCGAKSGGEKRLLNHPVMHVPEVKEYFLDLFLPSNHIIEEGRLCTRNNRLFITKEKFLPFEIYLARPFSMYLFCMKLI